MYTITEHYEPLRSYLTTQSVLPGLETVWRETKQHSWLSLQQALHGTVNAILPWELELLARELILNGNFTACLNEDDARMDLGKAVWLLRGVIEAISRDCVHSMEDALAAVVPLLHQQIRWSDDSFSTFIRYIRIFRQPSLLGFVEQQIEMELSDWLTLGLAVYGMLKSSFEVDRSIFIHTPGMSTRGVDRFFELTAAPIEDMSLRLQSALTYERQWAHSFNHLRERPVLFLRSAPSGIFAPIPQLLLWRLTDGLYFELVGQNIVGFDQALGAACEHYVGEVLYRVLNVANFAVQGERPYHVGKDLKKGVDWLVSDCTGHLFIECKAKRLKLAAKMSVPGEAMDEDLAKMAGFIVQNYLNIQDAFRGYVPEFDCAGRPMFSVIATLEDWALHTPELEARLHKMVAQELEAKQMSTCLIDDWPYTILSFFELERRVQDIAKVGIATAFKPGTVFPRPNYKGCLFPETLKEMMPKIAQKAGFDRLC